MDEHTIYHNLLEAMEQTGCPVCRLSRQAVASYLDHLLYADVNSIERRAEIRAAQGFCATHASALVSIGRALGIAIICKDVIDNLLRALPSATGEPCPACTYYTTMEEVYIGGFAKHLSSPSFQSSVVGSEGLCLTHFRMALTESGEGGRRQFLIQQQTDRWQSLSVELGEYIRKNDYRFRSEGFGAESNAWERALDAISSGRDKKEPRRKAMRRFRLGRKTVR